MLGIIFLDQYLSKTHQDIWLIEAIHHLGRAEPWLEREDSQQALAALQALAFYLNRDFEKALGFLGARKKKTFEENFTELIQKVA
jgi:hypothetical protein